jgi:hypothetical protein
MDTKVSVIPHCARPICHGPQVLLQPCQALMYSGMPAKLISRYGVKQHSIPFMLGMTSSREHVEIDGASR